MKPKINKTILNHAGDPDAVTPLPDNTDGRRFLDVIDGAVPVVREYTQVRLAKVAAAASHHAPTGRCPVDHSSGDERFSMTVAQLRTEQNEIKYALVIRRMLVLESVWKERMLPWLSSTSFGLPVKRADEAWQELSNPQQLFMAASAQPNPTAVLWQHCREAFWMKVNEWKQEMRVIIEAHLNQPRSKWPSQAKLCLEYIELLDAYTLDLEGSKTPDKDLNSGFNTAMDVMWGTIDVAPKVFQTQFGRFPTSGELEALITRSFRTVVMPIARKNVAHADSVLFGQIAHPDNPFRKKGAGKRLFPLNPAAFQIDRGGLVISPSITGQAYAINPVDTLTTGCPAQRIIPEVWKWVLQLYKDFGVYQRLIDTLPAE